MNQPNRSSGQSNVPNQVPNNQPPNNNQQSPEFKKNNYQQGYFAEDRPQFGSFPQFQYPPQYEHHEPGNFPPPMNLGSSNVPVYKMGNVPPMIPNSQNPQQPLPQQSLPQQPLPQQSLPQQPLPQGNPQANLGLQGNPYYHHPPDYPFTQEQWDFQQQQNSHISHIEYPVQHGVRPSPYPAAESPGMRKGTKRSGSRGSTGSGGISGRSSRRALVASPSITPNESPLPLGNSSPSESGKSVSKRSRMGCLTCRQRKKRCCETRPKCTECLRLRLNCVWPVPGTEHKNKPKDAKEEENTINHEIYGKIKVLRGIVEYRSS